MSAQPSDLLKQLVLERMNANNPNAKEQLAQAWVDYIRNDPACRDLSEAELATLKESIVANTEIEILAALDGNRPTAYLRTHGYGLREIGEALTFPERLHLADVIIGKIVVECWSRVSIAPLPDDAFYYDQHGHQPQLVTLSEAAERLQQKLEDSAALHRRLDAICPIHTQIGPHYSFLITDAGVKAAVDLDQTQAKAGNRS